MSPIDLLTPAELAAYRAHQLARWYGRKPTARELHGWCAYRRAAYFIETRRVA